MKKPQNLINHMFVFIKPNEPLDENWYENTGFDTDINAANLLKSKAIKELMAKGYTKWERVFTIGKDNQPIFWSKS
jgi:hypothetical protein